MRVNGTRLGRPKTASAKIKQAKDLRQQGKSYGEIAKAMGINRNFSRLLRASRDRGVTAGSLFGCDGKE